MGVIFPFIHRGVPRNDVEVSVFKSKQIVTGKGGKAFSPQPEIIRRLKVRKWFGISSPRKARWFFGFMRWEEK